MAIYDSYSKPAFGEYNWSDVDWDDPMPDDVCALFELAQQKDLELFLFMRDIVLGGKDRESIPRRSIYLWDEVVRVVGLSDELAIDEDTYTLFDRLRTAGSFVHEDRKYALMDDDELNEVMEIKMLAKQAVDEMVESGDFDKMVSHAEEKMEQRHKEVDFLNSLFDDESEN